VEKLIRFLGPDNLDVSELLTGQGRNFQRLGRFAEAEGPLRDFGDGTPVRRPPDVPDVPYPWYVSPDPVSPLKQSGMRTILPTRKGGDAGVSPIARRLLIERAAEVVAELERAAWETMPGGGTATALAFVGTRNSVTAERGIVVRRWLGGSVYSRPLAELLAPSGDLDDRARDSADLLCAAASNGRLKIFVNQEGGKTNPGPVAFAAIDLADKPDSIRLLARLLVDSLEVEQWADPLVEAAVGGVS
jgi:hypothetical protein